MNNLDHERYMRRAIGLAGKVPDQPFGAVIVDRDSGNILSEGLEQDFSQPDLARRNRRHQHAGLIRCLCQGEESRPLHDRRALSDVPSSDPLDRYRNGRLRYVNSFPAKIGLATDRHSGGRSRSSQSSMEMHTDRRRDGAGMRCSV